ncbi:MAG: hypothetical protein K9N46_01835 [Candidatus Marinimicrobia bacterium]|nr:hypothetical protein [Candidatus Neomarinimicrobiota bacterium]MCF7827782.1 hypothetical protein [Candidatus Neomarinimicrobiota bacterium]MCF7879463.1 hypothetical protein [Candidatus Neomarinimicrobiota bacterium]
MWVVEATAASSAGTLFRIKTYEKQNIGEGHLPFLLGYVQGQCMYAIYHVLKSSAPRPVPQEYKGWR